MPRRPAAVPAAFLLLAAACASGPGRPITVAGVGFATPESVLHDPTADVYLVSNINGSPLAEDGNGFISRVSPDGRVLDLKWIDGAAPGVTLNAPKGMALRGSALYVTDINVVRRFDRTTGEPLGDIHISNATFLNDLAPAANGDLYLTDSGLQAGEDGFAPSGTDAVYRVGRDGTVELIAHGAELGGPNGVHELDGQVWVVSFGSGELYRLVNGSRANVLKLEGGMLDGVESVDGELLISSWEAKAVFRGPPSGPFTPVVTDVEAPADIGWDARRNRLLIPLFLGDAVRIVPLPGPAPRGDVASDGSRSALAR
jgi:hypothetical protein